MISTIWTKGCRGQGPVPGRGAMGYLFPDLLMLYQQNIVGLNQARLLRRGGWFHMGTSVLIQEQSSLHGPFACRQYRKLNHIQMKLASVLRRAYPSEMILNYIAL